MRSHSEYIPLTQDQIALAQHTDIVEYLRERGERVQKEGNHYIWEKHDSCVIHGFGLFTLLSCSIAFPPSPERCRFSMHRQAMHLSPVIGQVTQWLRLQCFRESPERICGCCCTESNLRQ